MTAYLGVIFLFSSETAAPRRRVYTDMFEEAVHYGAWVGDGRGQALFASRRTFTIEIDQAMSWESRFCWILELLTHSMIPSS